MSLGDSQGKAMSDSGIAAGQAAGRDRRTF